MNRIKRSATESPLIFGLGSTLSFVLIIIVSTVIGNVWPGEPYRPYIGGTIVRVVSIIILLLLISRLGWLHSAGLKQPGRPQTWFISFLPLAYAIAASAYAMTGNLDFHFSDPRLIALIALFIMTAALLEEIVFRGLILQALVQGFSGTNRGPTIKRVLVASLFFSGMHLVNILGGQPLPDALLQSVVAFFLGIFLAALVLHGSSLYPAVFFHAALNWAGYLNLTGSGVEATASSWLLLSLLLAPLALFGLFILRGRNQRPLILDAA